MRKKIKNTIYHDDGRITFVVANAATADWLRFGRLCKRASMGDKVAKKEAEKMENDVIIEGI